MGVQDAIHPMVKTMSFLTDAFYKIVEVEYLAEDEIKTETFSLILPEDKKALQTIIEDYEIQTMHTKEATLEEIFIKASIWNTLWLYDANDYSKCRLFYAELESIMGQAHS